MSLIDIQNYFYGRRDVLDLLTKRVLGLKDGYRQNIALLGSRYVGKTSIVERFLLNFEDRDIIVLYLNLESHDFNHYVLQLCKGILYYYLKSKGAVNNEELAILIESNRQHIPLTCQAIESIQRSLKESRNTEAYQDLLNLPEIFNQETKKSLVLILDEFQNMEQFPVADVYVELGKRIMTQKYCLYITTSSDEEHARAILSEKLSLLFGNFEIIEIQPFDLASSQGLIDHNLENLKIGLYLKNFLADFTGGYPLYINVISQEIVSLAALHRQTEVYAPILTQSIENLVFNPWGIISRHFELILSELRKGKSANSLIMLIIALAEGYHRMADASEYLGIKPAIITQRINSLLEAGLVEKNGNYYHIKDKVFRYWIKYVYQRRIKAIDLEPGRSRKLFKEEINKTVNDFQMIARKDLSSRMIDLMHKFDDEAFELHGRKYKLNTFNEISPLKLRLSSGNSLEVLVANSTEGSWLMVLKKDPLLDHDLSVMSQEIKKLEFKPSRCVLVCLNGVEENAKVRALQEKWWVWNEQQINTLMHLYDEPYLTR